MADQCCAGKSGKTALNDPRWRRILWIALIINAAMFGVEIVAGVAADSRALQADALDFLGDSANYAISLGVAGMALAWRARAALPPALRRLGGNARCWTWARTLIAQSTICCSLLCSARRWIWR